MPKDNRTSLMIDKDTANKFKANCILLNKKPAKVANDIIISWIKRNNKKLQEVVHLGE
jgi:hypothetical protein